MSGMRRLGTPRPVRVQAVAGGVPSEVGRTAVDAVADEWVVEDRWWTGRPLARRYFELVLADGRSAVVFVRRNAEKQDRLQTKILSSARFIDNFLHRQLKNSRHAGDRLPLIQFFAHEQRQNKIVTA